MEELKQCSALCRWLRRSYDLPFDYEYTCGAANDQLILKGKSLRSLRRRWSTDVDTEAVSTTPCVAPDKKDIIPLEDRPYGGRDPFESVQSDDEF